MVRGPRAEPVRVSSSFVLAVLTVGSSGQSHLDKSALLGQSMINARLRHLLRCDSALDEMHRMSGIGRHADTKPTAAMVRNALTQMSDYLVSEGVWRWGGEEHIGNNH